MGVNNNDIQKVISLLMEKNFTISFMEACSGGSIANAFTNIRGAGNVLKFSAVTYSDEFKILMGVNPKTIEKYTSFSTPVVKEMAKSITKYANSQFGVAVTGNLNLVCNDGAKGGELYISIYNKITKHYTTKIINVQSKNRQTAKDAIVNFIASNLIEILTSEQK